MSLCVEATVTRGAAVDICPAQSSRADARTRAEARSLGCDLVAVADLAVAEYIGAQASLVDERSQYAGLSRLRGQAFEVRARLAQPLPEALDGAGPERFADERVEIDAAGDDVPAGLFWRDLADRKLQRPLALGADVVIHSATKAIGGHSDLLLGAAVATDHGRLARLHEIRKVTGATPGALEIFLCLRGLRTLPLRLERAQHNATLLAQRLSEHLAVQGVRYPKLDSHPQHERAGAMAGPGFMLTFRVHGGIERADAVLNSLELVVHATSLGGVETTIERRAKYPAERHIPADLLRVSVGCENVEDLWNDLRQAPRPRVSRSVRPLTGRQMTVLSLAAP